MKYLGLKQLVLSITIFCIMSCSFVTKAATIDDAMLEERGISEDELETALDIYEVVRDYGYIDWEETDKALYNYQHIGELFENGEFDFLDDNQEKKVWDYIEAKNRESYIQGFCVAISIVILLFYVYHIVKR